MKSMLLLLALCILTTASLAQDHPALTALPNSIYVGADGKFESAPDTAVIQFNISVQETTSQKAYEHASKEAEQVRHRGILLRTTSLRVEQRQTKTDRLSRHYRRHPQTQRFLKDRPHHPATSRCQRQRNPNCELHSRKY